MPFETCLNCLARWRLWIRPVVIFIYALAALVFVPLFLVKSLEDGFNKRDQENFDRWNICLGCDSVVIVGNYSTCYSLHTA
jgi:hypothetical protein